MLSTSFGCLGNKEVQVVVHPNLFSYCGFADFYDSVCGLGDIQGKAFLFCYQSLFLPVVFSTHFLSESSDH